MAELDAPNAATMDAIDMKVSAALLPLLLGTDGILRYDNDGDRVAKANYKSFIERISYNVSTMIANRGTTEITNDRPMTRERIARDLMNSDDRTPYITMEEHSTMMNAQQTSLLGTVEVMRRLLVAHGIVISNLAERTLTQRWEISCIATQLLNTIEKKDAIQQDAAQQDAVRQDAAQQDAVRQDAAQQGAIDPSAIDPKSTETFFDPASQKFNDTIAPIILKVIDAHECLCATCNPDFKGNMYADAHNEAQAEYEKGVSNEAKRQLYKDAIHKFRDEVESAAVREIRQQVRKELKGEIILEYRESLKKKIEEE